MDKNKWIIVSIILILIIAVIFIFQDRQQPVEDPLRECFVGGCSSEICSSDPEAMSSCEYLPGAICLQEEGVACQLVEGDCFWVLSEAAAACFLEAEEEYGTEATETRIKHLFEKARAF